MAFFRSKLQIFVLFSPNNKYNLFLRQQPWHYVKSILYSKKTISDDCNGSYGRSKQVLSKGRHQNESRREYFCSSQGRSSTKVKRKQTNCKQQKQKLTLWERLFGPGPRKSWPDSSTCRLAYRQRRQIREKDPRLLDPRHQATPGDVLIYTDKPICSLRKQKSMEAQPKPPPEFKAPTAVLLSRMMLEGFDRKGDNCEGKKVTLTFRKPYDEMKPPSEKITKYYRNNVRSENIKSCEEPTHGISIQMSVAATRDSTIKILRQAMEKEDVQARSRIEQLKLLVNDKMFKSRRASSLSRTNPKNRLD
ncbi:hypothetical protein DMN91_006619 [Ooceraea biroi]|uniref:Uncharacterized protein n=1 Tax=Ooceraea biroi TaxID=2015173 RepID=A0A3L8DIP5_OOCBI|nr:uncharacterized protein LOC105277629 isoform X2 [Ooceraea biroi]RLU20013.1 hypothetical protein DMN91_006619 [Ooceraea biroi]